MMSDVVEDGTKESIEEETHSVLPGQKLKRARENRNLEQTDIAKELKLDLRFVKALEDGRYNELPQPVYTAGYVRAYSKLVGLVPDEIVSEYTSQQKSSTKPNSNEKEKEPIPSHYRQVQTDLPKSFSVGHTQSEDKRKFNIFVSILAVVVVFAIIWQISNQQAETTTAETTGGDVKQSDPSSTGSGDKDQNTIDLPLPEIDPKSTDSDLIKSSDKSPVASSSIGEESKITEELVENASKITELSLHYSADSWVDIRDSTGKPIIRKLGKAGRSSTVSGIPPFEVLLGYSPGVSIELDGKTYDMSPYSEKRVARFVLGEEPAASSNANQQQEGQAVEKQSTESTPASENTLPEDF